MFITNTRVKEMFHKDVEIKVLVLLAYIVCMVLAWDGPFFSDDSVYTYWTTKQLLSGKLYLTEYTSYQGLGYSLLALPFFVLAEFFAESPKMGMRLTNIFLFPFTIWLTYKIGHMIYSKKVGILGAILFGFGTFAIEYALKAMSHIPAVLFILASLYIALKSKDNFGTFEGLLAGITSVYALLIRFEAWILFLIIPGYWLISAYARSHELKKIVVQKLCLYFVPLVTLIVAVSLILPDFLANIMDSVRRAMLYPPDRSPISELTRLDGGNAFWLVFIDHSGVLFPNHLPFKYKSSLIQSSPFLVLSIFGFVYLFKKKRPETIFLLLFMLLTVLFYFSVTVDSGGLPTVVGGYAYNPRYLHTLLPILSIACAVTLSNWYKHFSLSMLVGGFITGLIVLVYDNTLWNDVIHYSRILYFLDRTPINAPNLVLAFTLLFVSGCYVFLEKRHIHPFDSIFRDLTISITFVAFITSIVNNVIINCLGTPILYYGYPRVYPDGSILRINGPSAGARILPMLDGVFYLFGVDLPGKGFLYTHRGGITAVPLFYWLFFLVPVFLLILFIFFSLNKLRVRFLKIGLEMKNQLLNDISSFVLFFHRKLHRNRGAVYDITKNGSLHKPNNRKTDSDR